MTIRRGGLSHITDWCRDVQHIALAGLMTFRSARMYYDSYWWMSSRVTAQGRWRSIRRQLEHRLVKSQKKNIAAFSPETLFTFPFSRSLLKLLMHIKLDKDGYQGLLEENNLSSCNEELWKKPNDKHDCAKSFLLHALEMRGSRKQSKYDIMHVPTRII